MITNNLKNLRLEKGYTQKQLSRLSGVSTTCISDIETKKVINVKICTAKALARALKTSIEDIFGK